MHNIKLTLAYDGTDFSGWQIQPGRPTIQGALVEVLGKLTQESVTLHGAGRTDAGVHALGQVAHFRTHSELLPAEFQRACNALLPPAIRVVAAEEVGPDFHARWHAVAKTYRYRLFRGRVVPPFVHRYVLHYPYPLNGDAMRVAAPLFVGTHDFTSFAASTGSEEDDRERSALREIYRAAMIEPEGGEELHFEVRGKSFLRFMVRKMVGTLLDVGRGRLTTEDIPRLFDLRDRSKSGPTVPPQGLCMVSVEYSDPWKPSSI
ncbi:MAG TPA: tRNA pseudouridine(38-40) synthase TruA [Candidatus Acidoferrales bacterium]|nr:tRNA pseudouridine(38-40) synthase TruA [Candidatus Acidoferrales bacterium]